MDLPPDDAIRRHSPLVLWARERPSRRVVPLPPGTPQEGWHSRGRLWSEGFAVRSGVAGPALYGSDMEIDWPLLWTAGSAIGTVAAAGVAAYAAWKAGRIATEDRQAAIKAQQDAQQPYVWADFRTDNQVELFQLVVVNDGPSTARNVIVTFDPPLTSTQPEWARLPEVIASMPPGRVLAWEVDTVHGVFDAAAPMRKYNVRITGEGPHGPLPVGEYVLDLHDYMNTSPRPATEAAALGNELRDAAKVVSRAIKDAARAPQLLRLKPDGVDLYTNRSSTPEQGPPTGPPTEP